MITRLAWIPVALLLGACSVSSFDRHLAAQRWSDAADAFDADSSLLSSDRALYRAALLHASPALPTWEPLRARELLAFLLTEHPGSMHRESALRLVELIDEMESRRMHAEARQQQLETQRARLQNEVADLRTQLNATERRMQATDEESALLRAAVERLQLIVRDREEQLRQLRQELDRLKAIDLRVPPRAGGGT
jgi:peptidoglycan hydrolase CwlO-like protein